MKPCPGSSVSGYPACQGCGGPWHGLNPEGLTRLMRTPYEPPRGTTPREWGLGYLDVEIDTAPDDGGRPRHIIVQRLLPGDRVNVSDAQGPEAIVVHLTERGVLKVAVRTGPVDRYA